MKKLVSVLLALALIMAAGLCAFAEESHNEPGVLPIVNEPLTLTIGLEQSTSVEDWYTNEMTKYVEEQTGLKLEFVVYPKGEFNTKVELLMNSDTEDLPDIFFGNFSQNQLMPWAEAGKIIPTTEYYDELEYWSSKSIANEYPENVVDWDWAKGYVTSYDGNIWGIVRYAASLNGCFQNSRINIFLPWVKQLGMEIPTTMEDYYDYLVAVRDNDMNGNGDASDEIPLTGFSGSIANFRKAIMTPFVYTQNEYWTVDKDGTIGVCFNTDEWREGLRFVRKLFAEGLADEAMFTQDEKSMTATMTMDDQVVGSFIRVSSSNLPSSDPDRYQYVRANYLTGFDGNTNVCYVPSAPQIYAIITANCKNPEIAFMFMDYLCSTEISAINRYGFGALQGEIDNTERYAEFLNYWQNVAEENLPEKLYGDPAHREYIILNKYEYDSSKWNTLQNTWWGAVGPHIYTQQVVDWYTTGGDISTELGQMAYEYEYRARYALTQASALADTSKVVGGLIYTPDENDVITDFYSEIKTYVETTWAAFALGTLDIEDDAVWEDYLAQLDKMNLDSCIDATQSCYTRQFSK